MSADIEDSVKAFNGLNQRIVEILKMPEGLLRQCTSKPGLSSADLSILEKAAQAYSKEYFQSAANYYKKCTNIFENFTNKCINNNTPCQFDIVVEYMLGKCLLQSKQFTDLLEAQNILHRLDKIVGKKYPMIYYALGQYYIKVFCFKDAEKMINTGLSILNNTKVLNNCFVPGTNDLIVESTKDGCSTVLLTLKEQSSGWHRPDAVCFMTNCKTISQNHVADRNIYFKSPAFAGMVVITCNNVNPCLINFHAVCWKAKKDELFPQMKMSEKECLGLNCFTPNCECGGEISTIKKIDIYNEDAKIKTTIEAPEKRTQVLSAKGAIKKQKIKSHEIKIKTNDVKMTKNHKPKIIQATKLTPIKRKTHCEDDELNYRVAKLIFLREANFHIDTDNDWRPDSIFYGNTFMRESDPFIPIEPELVNDTMIDLKKFVYSFFYTFISENAPVKTDMLMKKWSELNEMIPDTRTLLYDSHYTSVAEYLIKSLKFVVIGGYICTPATMVDTYQIVKDNICTTLKCLMADNHDTTMESGEEDEEDLFGRFTRAEELLNSCISSPSSENSSNFEKNNNIGIENENLTHDTVVHHTMINDNSKLKDYEVKESPNNVKCEENFICEAEIHHEDKKINHINGLTDEINKKMEISQEISGISMKSNNTNEDKEKITLSGAIEDSKLITQTIIPEVNGEIEKLMDDVQEIEIKKDNRIKTRKREFTEANKFEIPNGEFIKIKGMKFSPRKLNENSIDKENVNLSKQLYQDASPIDTKTCAKTLKFEVHDLKNQLNINSVANPIEMSQLQTSPTNSAANIQLNHDTLSNNVKINVSEQKQDAINMDTSRIKELEEQVRKLTDELATTKIELMSTKMMMMQADLRAQYEHRKVCLDACSDLCRKEFAIVTKLQNSLLKILGTTLPLDDSEWKKPLQLLDYCKKSLTEELNKKLAELKSLDNCLEVDKLKIKLVQLPELPQRNVPELLQVAFDMCQRHFIRQLELSQQLIPSHPVFVNSFIPLQYSSQPLPHKRTAFPPTPPNVNQFSHNNTPPTIYNSPPKPSVNCQVSPKPKKPTTSERLKAAESDKLPEKPASKLKAEEKTKEKIVNTKTINGNENIVVEVPKEETRHPTHSLDKLMTFLRSRNKGVLEYDLLCSIKNVKMNHNNSLTGIPLSKILLEAEAYLKNREKLQLANYSNSTIPPGAKVHNGEERQRNLSVSSNSSARSPARENLSKKNPWTPVTDISWKKEVEELECAICCEYMSRKSRKTLYTLKCQHTFHDKCIREWFTQSRTCPTCRVHSTLDDEFPPLP